MIVIGKENKEIRLKAKQVQKIKKMVKKYGMKEENILKAISHNLQNLNFTVDQCVDQMLVFARIAGTGDMREWRRKIKKKERKLKRMKVKKSEQRQHSGYADKKERRTAAERV